MATTVVMIAFFVSGASALVYQLCWQRLLFAVIGIDIESVTLIVSAFMLGLGVGAVIGGQIADRYPQELLRWFAIVEATIGVFGFFSPFVIDFIGVQLATAPRALTVAAQFVIFLLPTICMGATLPILVRWIHIRVRNIGASVGSLYFINTLGAAVGVVGVGFWLLHALDLRQSIWLAATANLAVAAVVAIGLKVRS
ncbi:MAG: fused MFS/spermidine synthase [Casimicrobium sp.]